MHVYAKCYVQYHSHEWDYLADSGWFTVTVDAEGIAEMWRLDP